MSVVDTLLPCCINTSIVLMKPKIKLGLISKQDYYVIIILLPPDAAKCSGLLPLLSVADTLAPCWIISSTILSCPEMQTHFNFIALI